MKLKHIVAAVAAACVLVPSLAHAAAPGPTAATPAMRVPAREPAFAAESGARLWARIHASRDLAVIGLKAPGQQRGVWRAQVLVSASQRRGATDAVLAQPGVRLVSSDKLLPAVTVRLAGPRALAAVRALAVVDYVQPLTSPGVLSSDDGFGCEGASTDSGGVPYGSAGDVFVPGDVLGDTVPWNYDDQHVRQAWVRGTGAGATVGVIDTGGFPEQSQIFLPGFAAQPYSGDRYVIYAVTSGDSDPYDRCNHGTRMASTVAAPRDGRNIVGVAWKANLVNVKVHNDVPIYPWDSNAVATGIHVAVQSGARIITMALGTQPWDFRVADQISYEYYRPDKNVMFVAAAGTTMCTFGVVFPAKMAEVVAVTGMTPYRDIDPSACSGPEVDVAAIIGELPAAGRHEGDVIHFGGTSDASAVISGIAALVWSAHPDWNRDQVTGRLYGSGFGYLHDRWGWGVVDAYRAVGGFAGLTIAGPNRVDEYQTYKLTAVPQGEGPFTYRWSNGATTPSITVTSGELGTSQRFTVTVTDTRENKTLSAAKTVWANLT